MNDYIDTREGWVRYEIEGATPIRDEGRVVMEYRDRQAVAYWLPEVPVPPLPTEPWTVIEVTWAGKKAGRGTVFTLNRYGTWFNRVHDVWHERLQEEITGFEVLAEPRAIPLETDNDFEERVRRETAKAVLDRVRAAGIVRIMVAANPKNGDQFDEIARDFGVSS